MNRRDFLTSSLAATAAMPLSMMSTPLGSRAAGAAEEPAIAVLLVDTDRATVPIDTRIYGQFLEHINDSVEDGLFAEQIRGAGIRQGRVYLDAQYKYDGSLWVKRQDGSPQFGGSCLGERTQYSPLGKFRERGAGCFWIISMSALEHCRPRRGCDTRASDCRDESCAGS